MFLSVQAEGQYWPQLTKTDTEKWSCYQQQTEHYATSIKTGQFPMTFLSNWRHLIKPGNKRWQRASSERT